MAHEALTTALVPLLRSLSDSERSFQRLLLQRGGPQDLGVIRDMMRTCLRIAQESKKLKSLHPALYILIGAVVGLAMGYLRL